MPLRGGGILERERPIDDRIELAGKIAGNAPITNFAVIHALPRIAEANPREGFMMEALMAAVAQGSEEAKDRLRAFLEKRAKKVTEV